MTDARAKLLDLICRRAFRTGDFTLASGEMSNYYIDGRMVAVCPAGAALIGEVLHEVLVGMPEVQAIGGMAVGAVPLVASAMVICHQRGLNVEGFWVRDVVKGHGAKKLIEGKLEPDQRVLIVDDVVTTGGSSVKAIQAVRDHGCHVVKVVSLVDRDRGARETFRELGINYEPIFTKDELFAHQQAVASAHAPS